MNKETGNERKVQELEKTQLQRLVSIFVFSPFMLYIATKDKLSPAERMIIMYFSVGTFIAVGYTYLENRRRLKELQDAA